MDFETWRTYLEKYGPPKPVIDDLETMIYEIEEWPTNRWEDWRKRCLLVASRLNYYAAMFTAHAIADDET